MISVIEQDKVQVQIFIIQASINNLTRSLQMHTKATIIYNISNKIDQEEQKLREYKLKYPEYFI